ncbi:uncharacterized protein BX664DRAFT_257493 [Halteromyces radiatus]|uniref:uncharacterized protein n=1 Tax=Halteromyces radiatus TaxID=101107 RepID=UPI00221FA1DE|nr:uncharacterized protein BX664DRAFT_257493 [Halteromyces radiatus]KAI8097282.1 hypothetical protein BX664DRAFT_257493 [Halteromyces radiatus]
MKKVGHEWTIGEYNEFFLVNLYQARYEDILATYKGETFTKSGLKLSIGSFNAILATYIKLGQEKEAAALIREAQERWGLIPDIRDFNRSMNRCMPRDTEVVTKGRDWIAQYGFDKVEVINTNLQHLFRDELVDEAVWIYDTLNKRNIPLELSTCTLLIKNLTDAKRLRLVSTIYDDMTQRGLKPNPSICGSMLSMYAHRRHEQKAENVVRDMVMAGHPMNEHIYNQLIKVYFKSRNLKKALQAFEEIHRHPKLQLNEVILNTMVDGLVINREIQAASVLYRQMLSTNSKIKPDMVTFNTLFKGFVKAKEFTLASGVIQDMYRYKCEPDTVTYTTLINSIFEYKQPRNTKELMGHVLGMGMTPNIYTFNAMINGWVRHQNMTEAEATLQLLQSSTYKLSPTIHTMTNLIQGYVETLNLPKAMETFQYAVSRGIKPDRAAYNFLITGFIDHDRFDDAVTCLRYMRQNNLNPNKDTWTMLMAQCVRKKLWKTGSILVKEMENSGFELWNPSLRLPNELVLYILRQFLDLADVWRLLQVSTQLRQLAIDTIQKRWKIELVFTPETTMKIQCRAALIALERLSTQLCLQTRYATTPPNGTCDNKLFNELMLKEERLHQRIIHGISSYKHKYVLIEDIDIRNRIRATVDVIFHHTVFVAALSRQPVRCSQSSDSFNNNRSLAAMMVRLLTRLDAAFPSYCREITYTLADHIKAFLEYTGYKLLAQLQQQQQQHQQLSRSRISACFDLMGAAFIGKILGETHVECAVQRTCELLTDERHLLGLVKKVLLVDLLDRWLTIKRGLVAGELCRLIRSEIETCDRQQQSLLQQQDMGGFSSLLMEQQQHHHHHHGFSQYRQRAHQQSSQHITDQHQDTSNMIFLPRPSSIQTRYQLS